MRTITAVTVGRSDFGIYAPILRAIQSHNDLRLHLVVTGAHLSSASGRTVREIESQGFEIGDRVEMLLSTDTPTAIATSMGLGTIGLSQVYARVQPDLLLVLGDRFEMHAAALAAVPFRLPIAHVHGGEVTTGAIDDAFRHAITKYSHLHFTSTVDHARRVTQLGEEPWRITVSGAPALDNLHLIRLLTIAELESAVEMELKPAPLIVTFHPVTRQFEQTIWQTEQLLEALSHFDLPIVITQPNADTHGTQITERLETFAANHPRVRLLDCLGTRGYFSLMQHAAAMVGNSSSGIIEAASFQLPVVNIGLRQQGRPRSRNVIDVGHEAGEIIAAVRRTISPAFRTTLFGLENIFGDGHAATRIVERLQAEPLDERLLLKSFYDLPVPTDIFQEKQLGKEFRRAS